MLRREGTLTLFMPGGRDGSAGRGRCLAGRKSRAVLLDAAVKGLTTPRVQSGSPGFRCELMSCIGVFTLHLTDVNRGFGTIGRKQTKLSDSESD
jgi:hypothetical protein